MSRDALKSQQREREPHVENVKWRLKRASAAGAAAATAVAAAVEAAAAFAMKCPSYAKCEMYLSPPHPSLPLPFLAHTLAS